jgi:hypothetical protein
MSRTRFRPSFQPVLAVFVLALALGAAPSRATVVAPLTDTELVDASSAVVTGRCVATESRWIGRDLVTVATVEVDDAWKSDGETAAVSPSTLQVVLPGGIDADRPVPVAVTYPGAPSLVVGERAVLFLQPAVGLDDLPLAAPLVITGFSQGKLSIHGGDAGGDGFVIRNGRRQPVAALEAQVRRRESR